jgi:hypothetical protein
MGEMVRNIGRAVLIMTITEEGALIKPVLNFKIITVPFKLEHLYTGVWHPQNI